MQPIMCHLSLVIYIYIYRERERERSFPKGLFQKKCIYVYKNSIFFFQLVQTQEFPPISFLKLVKIKTYGTFLIISSFESYFEIQNLWDFQSFPFQETFSKIQNPFGLLIILPLRDFQRNTKPMEIFNLFLLGILSKLKTPGLFILFPIGNLFKKRCKTYGFFFNPLHFKCFFLKLKSYELFRKNLLTYIYIYWV